MATYVEADPKTKYIHFSKFSSSLLSPVHIELPAQAYVCFSMPEQSPPTPGNPLSPTMVSDAVYKVNPPTVVQTKAGRPYVVSISSHTFILYFLHASERSPKTLV